MKLGSVGKLWLRGNDCFHCRRRDCKAACSIIDIIPPEDGEYSFMPYLHADVVLLMCCIDEYGNGFFTIEEEYFDELA